MSGLLADVRHALRTLRREPGGSLLAVSALSVGIGFATTTFSLIDASILRPLPFDEPHTLVHVGVVPVNSASPERLTFSEVIAWRAAQTSFEDLGAYYVGAANVSDDRGQAERYPAAWVTAAVFRVLNVRPVIGRSLTESDGVPGARRVVILSHGLWRSRYGGDPNVVGRTLRVDGEPLQVVGIMPPGFAFPLTQQLWPAFQPEPSGHDNGERMFEVIGRLKRDVGLDRARAELTLVAQRIPGSQRPHDGRMRAEVRPLVDRYVSKQAVALLGVMLVSVLGVLAISCANVASLLFARSIGQARELAVRMAMGASRWRIVRQLFCETSILAVLGILGGLLLARVGMALLAGALADVAIPSWIEFRLDSRVLLFVVLLGALSMVMAGTLPALRAVRQPVMQSLADESGGTTSVRIRLWSRALVTAQIAISCALLSAAGLMLKTIAKVSSADYGFVADGVFVARVYLNKTAYPDDARIAEFYRQLVASLATLPNTSGVTLATTLPGWLATWSQIELGATHPRQVNEVRWSAVTPGFFATLGIPVLRGRALAAEDDPRAVPVMVVSKNFAERHFPGIDPLGQRVRFRRFEGPMGPWCTIVGVVGDVQPIPGVNGAQQFYVPLAQAATRNVIIMARTAGPASLLAPLVKQKVAALDPDMAIYEPDSLWRYLERAATFHRLAALLFWSFAFGALLLSSAGVYSVAAFSARRRTREVAIRMSVGATPADLRRLMLRQSTGQLLLGVSAGVVLGAWLAISMRAVLFGVDPLDPGVFASTALVVFAVGTLAGVRPTERAIRIDPVKNLGAP